MTLGERGLVLRVVGFKTQFFVHGRADFFVEDFPVGVVGVAFVVARSEVPEGHDEFVGWLVALDDGELCLVGVEDDEGGETDLDTEDGFGEAVSGWAGARSSGDVGIFGTKP